MLFHIYGPSAWNKIILNLNYHGNHKFIVWNIYDGKLKIAHCPNNNIHHKIQQEIHNLVNKYILHVSNIFIKILPNNISSISMIAKFIYESLFLTGY